MLINEVATLSGVSIRTLHYYDEIGLLVPIKNPLTNYREYSEEHLDRLQQILFYKELDFKLKHIQALLDSPDYNVLENLEKQRQLMLEKQKKLNSIIELIDKTIKSKEGELNMSNQEKFEGFKTKLIEENEVRFGEEIRKQHGEQSVMAAYGKLKEMTEEQFNAAQQLEMQLFNRLKENLHSEEEESYLLEIAELHKRWLVFYWPKYTKEAHLGLSEIYKYDERFKQYYNSNAGDGATELLIKSIEAYTK